MIHRDIGILRTSIKRQAQEAAWQLRRNFGGSLTTSLIWLPAALSAGLFQAWRTAVQQRLRAHLSVSGAGFVRYLYGAPIAVALAAGYVALHGFTPPHVTVWFFLFAMIGGLAQIFGTSLLIAAFGYRNYVVGTALAKTEVLQAALFSSVALDEKLGMLVIVGIGFGVAGILALSLASAKFSIRQIADAFRQPAALCGLGAGALFALTGISVKRATIEFGGTGVIEAAFATLAVVMLLQTLMHGVYLAWREPATLKRAASTWRTSTQVGVLSALGSACWFIGFATASVALVRLVGQVEVIFTFLFARLYLGESTRSREVFGLFLVVGGVLLALWGTLFGSPIGE